MNVRGWEAASSGPVSTIAASPRRTDGPTSARNTGSSICGGFPKDSFYYYQSWWTEKPVLHLFPHWNWPGYEGKKIAVWVYSNLDKVELLHNGQSLGTKDVKKDSHVAWDVEYAPGTIEARGWKGAKQLLTARRDTTGPAAKLSCGPIARVYPRTEKTWPCLPSRFRTRNGRTVPVTDNLVSFRVTGPARLIGVGNGDPTDQASDKGTSRKAFSGFCMALVQAEKTAGVLTVRPHRRGSLRPLQRSPASRSNCARKWKPGSGPFPKGQASPGCGSTRRKLEPDSPPHSSAPHASSPSPSRAAS